jgi:Na+/melibiose symporter-like transporter
MSNDRKIAFGSKVSFGVGQAAEGLKNWSFGTLILFYYNQVLEVPGTLCGLALGIALIFDAVTDPLAGSLSDNWKSRLGRRHPFMYAAALPLGICFFGLFSPPQLSTYGLFAWLVVFSILTRGAMTLYHVPHIALGAEMTENFVERTSIVAYRTAFGYLGGLLAAVIAFGYFFADARGGRTNADAYAPFAVLICFLMVTTIWYSAWGTRREIPALNLYMFQYFWELTGREILLVMVVSPLGLVTGTVFTRTLHRIWDKKPGLVVGTLGWTILQILPVILRLVEWFPANHTTQLLVALVAFRFVQGAIVQQAIVSFGSMMADVADEHELTSGRRQEGIFFGAVAFSGKAASGLGNIVAGIGLDVIAWPRGADIQTASDVAPETLVQLGLLYGPIVAGFGLVSVWCYTHYHLNRERHAEILRELRAARAARPQGAG